MSALRIFIDPGHARQQNRGIDMWESERNWRFSLVLERVLKERGAEVRMSKTSLNDDPTLTRRGQMAAEYEADVFLSIHSDANNSSSRRGVHIIRSISKPNSVDMGLKIVQAVAGAMRIPVRDRPVWFKESESRKGQNFDWYTVVDWASNYTRMGGRNGRDVPNSFLLEMGYHTNPDDARQLRDASLDEGVSHAMADALGLPKPQPEPAPGDLMRVQTGAFRVRDNATRLEAELKGKGYPTYLTQGADGLWRVQVGAFSNPDNAERMENRLKADGYATYIVGGTARPPSNPEPSEKVVMINVNVLNVRREPTTNSRITTTVRRGEKFTIVDEKDGWGKLKSGMGWIFLHHTIP